MISHRYSYQIAGALSMIACVMAGCGGASAGSSGGSGSSSSSSSSSTAAPVIISSGTASVNDGYAGVFYTAKATAAGGHVVTWTLDGADASKFTLDARTGDLAFASAPNVATPTDANADNTYDITLAASDGTSSANEAVSVTVDAWNKGGTSALPVPVVAVSVPKPAGTGANLKILPWAGFKSAVSYTFDDSSPSQIEHWNDLKAARVRSTFYINPQNNWFAGYDAALKDARTEGNELGNHTYHHCQFGALNGADTTACSSAWTVDEEFDKTNDYIKTTLGQPDVWTAAYPFGDTGYEPAAKTRFMTARGVGPGTIGASDATDPYNLPIIAHGGGDDVSVFNADLDTASSQGHWVVFLFHTMLPTTNDWGLGENIAAITGSMQHAKGIGTMWIDSAVNVGAYWTGEKLIEHATTSTSGGTTTWTWPVPAHFPAGRVVRVTVDGGTLSQGGSALPWNSHGYYEVSLDAGSLSWAQ